MGWVEVVQFRAKLSSENSHPMLLGYLTCLGKVSYVKLKGPYGARYQQETNKGTKTEPRILKQKRRQPPPKDYEEHQGSTCPKAVSRWTERKSARDKYRYSLQCAQEFPRATGKAPFPKVQVAPCAPFRQRPTLPTIPPVQEHQSQRQRPDSARHRCCHG